MRIDSHDIRSFRSVLRQLYIDAASHQSSPLHINYLKPRLRKFFPSTMTDKCLKLLILFKELVHLGQGWYGPTSGYKIDTDNLVVSLFGTRSHLIFENGSSEHFDVAQIEKASLSSWLGPPFLPISNIKAVGLNNPYETKEMSSGDEIYWTDSTNSVKNPPNWVVNNKFKSKRMRFVLSRQKGPFCFNYIQDDLGLRSSVNARYAYELMAVKDSIHGRPLPLTVLVLSGKRYSITPRRYHSTSMRRLLSLLSGAINYEEKVISYELSEAAFEKFKLLAANFVEIKISRRK